MSFLNFRITHARFLSLMLCALAFVGAGARVSLAQQQSPMTNEEFLAIVRQLPKQPALKEQLVSEIRQRGIRFTLTSGLRSFVATKSGNDEELRRALEEAERRFLNPKIASAAVSATAVPSGRSASVEVV